MGKVKNKAFFTVLMLSVVMLLGMIFGSFGGTTRAAFAADEEEGVKSFRFLGIGDTMTADALEYLYDAADSLGIADVVVGMLYQTNNTSIAMHNDNAVNNRKTYNYTVFYNSGDPEEGMQKDVKTSLSIEDALLEEKWDFISLQQSRELSGRQDSYEDSALNQLHSQINQILTSSENKNANSGYKLCWLMTWADLSNGVLSNYGTQKEMFDNISDSVNNKIKLKSDGGIFDLIIPTGTAVQNMRTSFAGDSLNSNSYRLGSGLGRFTASVSVLRALNLDVDILSIVPQSEDISVFYLPAIIESANNAVLKPFEVTESQFSDTPFDLSKYMQIDCSLQAWGYWNAVSETHYFKRITQETDCMYSIATESRLTINDLPVGAIIEVANGYMYRPEAWTDNSPQNPQTRKANVTAKYFEITEDWWDGYEMRAFNITTVINRAKAFETNDGVNEYFKIYVPMSSANTITRLEAGTRVGKITGNNITVNLPFDTDLKSVKVKVFTDGECTISPSTDANWDLTSPVQITVTAGNGATNVYTLTASLEAKVDSGGGEKKGCKGTVSQNVLLLTSLVPLAFILKSRKAT